MSQPKGSIGVALAVAAIIVIAVTSVGYYQFVVCKPNTCSTSTSASSSSAAPACAPPSCVTIQINYGAATLTTTAYSPDVATLVVGVNNTFQFHNNDSESGGVFHSATADSCPKVCPFDTGIIGYNTTMGPFTITTPGSYPYYCEVHPTTMVGTIIVKAGTSSVSSATTSTSATSSKSAAPSGAQITFVAGASAHPSSPGLSLATATVVVGVNNTITWTNNDTVGHTIIWTGEPSGVSLPGSEIVGPGLTYTTTLTVPGTYHYMDGIDDWIKGTIIVKAG